MDRQENGNGSGKREVLGGDVNLRAAQLPFSQGRDHVNIIKLVYGQYLHPEINPDAFYNY